MSFRYAGPIPSSKSMYNRALMIQSFFPTLKILGKSDCDDVRHMKKAIVSMIKKETIDCGEAGAVFRFMAMRASRLSGSYRLKGTDRLLQRPQEEVAIVLNQLGVGVVPVEDGFVLSGEGWQAPLVPLTVPRERSSQFASGVLLSAWDLPFELQLDLSGHGVSEGYWRMSVEMAKQVGMRIEIRDHHVVIPPHQKPTASQIEVEPDYSSMFSVAAAAVVNGDVRIQGVGPKSFQPDHVFINFLKWMKAPIELKDGELHVSRARKIEPLNVSLRECPDLFPVLAALCSFAEGTSVLHGAPQLAHKESDRIGKTKELLELAGIHTKAKSDGLEIEGRGAEFKPHAFVFDPDQDHRMAMAAALFRQREAGVGIKHIDVVKKSFPEFWKVVGLI